MYKVALNIFTQSFYDGLVCGSLLLSSFRYGFSRNYKRLLTECWDAFSFSRGRYQITIQKGPPPELQRLKWSRLSRLVCQKFLCWVLPRVCMSTASSSAAASASAQIQEEGVSFVGDNDSLYFRQLYGRSLNTLNTTYLLPYVLEYASDPLLPCHNRADDDEVKVRSFFRS